MNTLELVDEFHEAFGVAMPRKAQMPALTEEEREVVKGFASEMMDLGIRLKAAAKGNIALLRLQLIQEELAELAAAFLDGDIVDALDATVDLRYVVDGTVLTLGLEPVFDEAFEEVHRSNMSKLDADGKPLIHESGRVMKSDRYSPPDLQSLVEWKGFAA